MHTFLSSILLRSKLSGVGILFPALCALALMQGCFLFSGNGDTIYSEEAGEYIPVTEEVAKEPVKVEPKEVKSAEPSEDSANSAIFNAPQKKNLQEPLLQTGYRLRISVMVGETEELPPTEVQISDKEEITLPLLGKVSCAELTIAGLRSRLTSRYEEFMRDPEVNVTFAYSEDGLSPYGQVLVQGRVQREGWYNIPPTRVLKLSRVIQLAGGFSSSALKKSVRVTRKDSEGNPQSMRINVEAIGKKGDLDLDISLEPNDVIYVDESPW